MTWMLEFRAGVRELANDKKMAPEGPAESLSKKNGAGQKVRRCNSCRVYFLIIFLYFLLLKIKPCALVGHVISTVLKPSPNVV